MSDKLKASSARYHGNRACCRDVSVRYGKMEMTSHGNISSVRDDVMVTRCIVAVVLVQYVVMSW